MNTHRLLFFKKRLFYLSLLLMTFSYSFSQSLLTETKFRNHQDSIFKIMFKEPAKARKQIDYLLSIEKEMSDTTRALNYTLLGIYLNATGKQDSSILMLKKALDLSGNHMYRVLMIKNNLGNTYRNMQRFDESLKEFQSLLSYYEKIDDSAGMAKIYGQIAAVYNLTLKSEKAVENLTKSIRILEGYGDKYSDELGAHYQSLANTFMKQENFDYALDLYDKALNSFQKNDRMSNYYLTLINYAEVLNLQDKKDTALIVIDESIKGLTQFNNSRLLAVGYSVKGAILKKLEMPSVAKNNYALAFEYATRSNSDRTVQIARDYLELLIHLNKNQEAEELINETNPFIEETNIEYKYSYYDILAEFHAKHGNHKKAYHFSNLAQTLKDSSYRERENQVVHELHTKYQLDEKERLNNLLVKDIKDTRENLSQLVLIMFLVIFSVILTIVVVRTRLNYKNKILELEKVKSTELLSKLKIEKENAELKQSLIEQQKAELLGYSMEVSNMNEKIEKLIKKFELEEGEFPLTGQLRSLITVNKNWESFIERFKEVDPTFIPRLSEKYSKLTQKDLEFCSLVRINISYKDIANFLQISHESVFKKKYRISKKMDLDTETDFQKYIIHF